jgi:hypothetical protein
MRELAEVRLVESLAREGLGASQIAARTGIPRSTLRYWLQGHVSRRAGGCELCGREHSPAGLPPSAYSYLFALYLGDGCLLKNPRAWRLDITMDTRYPALIVECASAMAELMPENRVSINSRHPANCVIVRCYSQAWPCLFPQHGPGPKHRRRIALEPWQERIVDAEPEQFIRGLIHSDGCRVLNRVNGKEYPRYFFSQVSDDIRRLFCRSLRQLGIDYTWNDHKNVSIARARSVALLDEFVGPKR